MRGARAWPPPSHRRVVYPPAPSAHVGTYLAESHTRSRIGRPPLWPERRPRGGYHRAAHRTACGSLSISGTRPNGSWRIELTSGIEATANGGRQSLEDPLHPIAGRVGDRGGGVAGVELATASEPPARQPRIRGRRPSGVDPSHP